MARAAVLVTSTNPHRQHWYARAGVGRWQQSHTVMLVWQAELRAVHVETGEGGSSSAAAPGAAHQRRSHHSSALPSSKMTSVNSGLRTSGRSGAASGRHHWQPTVAGGDRGAAARARAVLAPAPAPAPAPVAAPALAPVLAPAALLLAAVAVPAAAWASAAAAWVRTVTSVELPLLSPPAAAAVGREAMP